MKRNTVYEPVGSANFRLEDSMLDKILANLSSYVKRMPTYIRVRVTESWLKLNDSLERLPGMKDDLMII